MTLYLNCRSQGIEVPIQGMSCLMYPHKMRNGGVRSLSNITLMMQFLPQLIPSGCVIQSTLQLFQRGCWILKNFIPALNPSQLGIVVSQLALDAETNSVVAATADAFKNSRGSVIVPVIAVAAAVAGLAR